jgi:uncharacterized protein YegP (UPF0339 family)
LAEALEGDRTDWARVRTLTDVEIDRAIAADSDTFVAGDDERSIHVRFVVLRGENGSWSWRLVASDGEIIARGQSSFPSRTSALAAMENLRRAISTSSDVAAA